MVLHLVFYLVPVRLPLSGFCPLPLLLLTLRGCSSLSGSSLRVSSCGGALWLGWRGLCCVTWFSPMCRALPQGLRLAQLSQLQVTLGFSCHPSFCFPGDVGWASALPFFASPAPLACRGWLGYAPCVRVLQLRWYLLRLTVRSPCCHSLTLGWVCFWPTVSQAFVGCEGGLGCPSWFVILFLCLLVLHLFWGWGGLVTGLWPLLRLLGFGLF